MNDYFQYVHNLKGVAQYEKFKPAARDAIISVFLRQIEDYNALEKTIIKETSKEVLQYISKHLNLKYYCKRIILSTDLLPIWMKWISTISRRLSTCARQMLFTT